MFTTTGSTGNLFVKLRSSKNFKTFILREKNKFITEPFYLCLKPILEEKKIKKTQLFDQSGIEHAFGFQLLRGTRKPGRDTVVQLAIGLALTVEETQKLLALAGHARLYPRFERDAAIIFSIERNLSFVDLQLLLEEVGVPALGDGKKKQKKQPNVN